MSLSRTPGRHAQPSRRGRRSALPESGTPDLLKTGPFPAVTPGSVLTAGDFRPEPHPPADGRAPGPGDETAMFTPDFAEVGALPRAYAPEPTDPPPAAARLLAMADGAFRGAAPLGDVPFFAGRRDGDDGSRHVAVCLGTGTFGRILFETGRADVLDALEAAVRTARDALVYGGFREAAAPPAPPAPPVPAPPAPVQDEPGGSEDGPVGASEPEAAVATVGETWLKTADDAAGSASAALDRALTSLPDPGAEVVAALAFLAGAVSRYRRIRRDDEQGLATWLGALEEASGDVHEAAERLAGAVGRVAGPDAAAFVRGEPEAAGAVQADIPAVPAAGGAR